MSVCIRITLLVIVSLGCGVTVFSQSADKPDPLVRVLQTKGILTEAEARAITANASPEDQRDRLATLLRDKGIISATEFDELHTTAPAPEMASKSHGRESQHRPDEPRFIWFIDRSG